jgi:hypothetical protein
LSNYWPFINIVTFCAVLSASVSCVGVAVGTNA